MMRAGLVLLLALLALPAAAQDERMAAIAQAMQPRDAPAAAAVARYDERITDYNSDITVARSGVLTVTETISVIAAGEQIHHGIYRDFPTDYTDKHGREGARPLRRRAGDDGRAQRTLRHRFNRQWRARKDRRQGHRPRFRRHRTPMC